MEFSEGDEQISLLTVLAQIFRKDTAELFRLPKFKDFFTRRQYCTGWISQSRDISQKRRLAGLLSLVNRVPHRACSIIGVRPTKKIYKLDLL